MLALVIISIIFIPSVDLFPRDLRRNEKALSTPPPAQFEAVEPVAYCKSRLPLYGNISEPKVGLITFQ